MTRRILILFANATLLLALSAKVGAIELASPARTHPHSEPEKEHEYEQEKPKQLYTCVMHPEIVRAEPGQCPKCGMTLVPLKESGKRSTSNAQHPMSKPEH